MLHADCWDDVGGRCCDGCGKGGPGTHTHILSHSTTHPSSTCIYTRIPPNHTPPNTHENNRPTRPSCPCTSPRVSPSSQVRIVIIVLIVIVVVVVVVVVVVWEIPCFHRNGPCRLLNTTSIDPKHRHQKAGWDLHFLSTGCSTHQPLSFNGAAAIFPAAALFCPSSTHGQTPAVTALMAEAEATGFGRADLWIRSSSANHLILCHVAVAPVLDRAVVGRGGVCVFCPRLTHLKWTFARVHDGMGVVGKEARML